MSVKDNRGGDNGAKGLGKEEAELSPQVTKTQSLGETCGLMRLRAAAMRDRKLQFTNLMHHITPEVLAEAYRKLRRNAAVGVDGISWQRYGEQLDAHVKRLHNAIQSGHYRPQRVKRVWIPKANGKQRPIGILTIEDKLVQCALVQIMESIYEPCFLGFSYGFRPQRSQHQALDAVYMAITTKKVSWVLDADIQAFFDSISHEWLLKFIEHRIADQRLLRLIEKIIKAEVIDGKDRLKIVAGTPQGAGISPLLANIYLHYVFDLWINQWRKTQARGDVYVVRYADDVVVMFQYRSDGEQFEKVLAERLKQFNLTLNADKTRLIEFGRFAKSNRQERGEGNPETFEFLGLMHQCSCRRSDGGFLLRRESIVSRQRDKLQEIKAVLMNHRHRSVYEVGGWLKRVVQGYFNYHAVPGNQDKLNAFRTQINRYWLKALRRRSQKSQVPWSKFQRLVRLFIPQVRILHPYPSQRLIV